MGNCCGKQKGAFQGEGRTLNAAPATIPSAPNGGRSAAAPKVSGPGRTLGSASADSGGPGPGSPGQAAARAAEARTTAPKPKGKLGRDLEARKSQTHNDTLNQTARDNLAARNADANTQTRNWN